MAGEDMDAGEKSVAVAETKLIDYDAKSDLTANQ